MQSRLRPSSQGTPGNLAGIRVNLAPWLGSQRGLRNSCCGVRLVFADDTSEARSSTNEQQINLGTAAARAALNAFESALSFSSWDIVAAVLRSRLLAAATFRQSESMATPRLAAPWLSCYVSYLRVLLDDLPEHNNDFRHRGLARVFESTRRSRRHEAEVSLADAQLGSVGVGLDCILWAPAGTSKRPASIRSRKFKHAFALPHLATALIDRFTCNGSLKRAWEFYGFFSGRDPTDSPA